MMKVTRSAMCWLLVLLGLAAATPLEAQSPAPGPTPDAAQSAQGAAENGGQDLSSQATDPTASLMAMNVIADFTTSYWDVDDSGVTMKFQPVVPFKAWGAPNILRAIVPYQTTGPGNNGLKDVSIFDLVMITSKRLRTRFGIGPVMSLSQSAGNAESKFAIGPAVGGVHRMSKRLNVGLFSQNLFAAHTAITQLQPVVAYQLGHGWALSAGDLQFVYDWKDGRWVGIPFGAQIGVVRALGGQPFRFSVNPQWNAAHIKDNDQFKLVVTVTLLAPAS